MAEIPLNKFHTLDFLFGLLKHNFANIKPLHLQVIPLEPKRIMPRAATEIQHAITAQKHLKR